MMNKHYNDMIYSNAHLEHHGVQGQKWGVTNGPPYPLGQEVCSLLSSASNDRLSNAMQTNYKNSKAIQKGIINLNNELNDKWDYGIVRNGQKVKDLSTVNMGSEYRTTPVSKLKDQKIGICWDFVNYQHDYFKSNGIQDHSYMFVMDKGNGDIVTHAFSTFENGGKSYWFESSCWSKRGVHEISDASDVAKSMKELYSPGKKSSYDLYEFNPDGMDRGLTDRQYFDKATENLVYTTQK